MRAPVNASRLRLYNHNLRDAARGAQFRFASGDCREVARRQARADPLRVRRNFHAHNLACDLDRIGGALRANNGRAVATLDSNHTFGIVMTVRQLP